MRINPGILILFILSGTFLVNSNNSFAGNSDRVGQAGASELLINPWARSSGWGGANSASARGLEAMFLNVAGTAFTKKTEVLFSHSIWLSGSDVKVNAFGLTQAVGKAKTSVLGLGLMSMSFGDIDITTTELPEGGIGKYSPQLMNIGISYGKAFSNSIYGGLTCKVISENISNLSAQGFAFDAGIQYVTSLGSKDNPLKKENLQFGIALKNVGPGMKFSGDGLSFRGLIPATGANLTVEQRTDKFELPSLVNIGATYTHRFTEDHKLAFAGNFTSNSFSKDQFIGGIEYAFRSYFMIRGGYVFEEGITKAETRTNVHTGPTAGVSFEIPMNKKSSSFGLDYSYRASSPFQGTHSMGVRIKL